MASLLSTYAAFSGLQADKQSTIDNLPCDFIALPVEKYISFQSSSTNQPAKGYDYWDLVIERLRPELNKLGISIIHLGLPEDTEIKGVTIDLRGQTTIGQTNYLIKNSLCHVTVDSMTAHVAGLYGTPLVSIYGNTKVGPHSPYWYNPTKTHFIESHRLGRNPTFSLEEHPKTISFIPPEKIVHYILCNLDISSSNSDNYETVYIGPNYNLAIIELIPNVIPAPSYNPTLPITVRMDKEFNENNLLGLLSTGRKVNILTDKPLSNECLNQIVRFRNDILSYNHRIVDDLSVRYVQFAKRIFKNCLFFCEDYSKEKLAEVRFKFFDIAFIHEATDKKKEDFIKDMAIYLNKEEEKDINLSNLMFKSNKYILSNGKTYSSHAHVEADIPTSNEMGQMSNLCEYNTLKVIDNQEFWCDSHYFNFIRKKV